MTGGKGSVQDDIRTIQHRISEIESNVGGQSRSTCYIMGGRNEQAALILRNNNQSDDCIDVVPDVVVCTVNWLRSLNYEAIPSSSSTFH